MIVCVFNLAIGSNLLFNSYEFIVWFLPTALLIYFILGNKSPTWAGAWLLACSLFFYGDANPRFLPVLVNSFFLNYLFGLGLIQTWQRPKVSRLILATGVFCDLAILGYYKYSRFFSETINPSWIQHWHLDQVVLPLGISFFTFTQIAFLVDASKGKIRECNPLHYALFVTYFPHLIAGPILHHEEMIKQFEDRGCYKPSAENLVAGFTIFAIGLFKKVGLADPLAGYVASAFHPRPAFLEAWGGVLSYTFQIYFDFSGYTDMAIGISLLFGFKLPINFNSPYRSVNIVDFWRRWHMTLSRFLRDYLYIPLGGGRQGAFRRFANIGVTMVLGGLWHGANWTFIAWGALHGAYLLINHGWNGLKIKTWWPKSEKTGFGDAAATGLTFLAVMVGWVLFRAENIQVALSVLGGMTGLNGPASSPGAVTLGTVGWSRLAICLGIVWFIPNTRQFMGEISHCLGPKPPEERWMAPFRWSPTWFWILAAVALFYGAMVGMTKEVHVFLYYQF